MEKVPLGPSKYHCELCDYHSNKRVRFLRHCETEKHKRSKKSQKEPKGSLKYRCEACDFICSKKSSFERHCQTEKHRRLQILTNPNSRLTPSGEEAFVCDCGKSYKHRSSLSQHKRQCSSQEAAVSDDEELQVAFEEELQAKLGCFQTELVSTLKGNVLDEDVLQSKLEKALKEILPQMVQSSITNNHNITNNNNSRITNNHIHMFLKENCANAMSIQEFAKQIKFTTDELLLDKHDSLVKVINNNLRPLALNERPVHCTNLTRRGWHVNDETEGWRPDDGSTLIGQVSDRVVQRALSQYADTFPDWQSSATRKDEYVRIARNTATDMEPKAEGRVLSVVGKTALLDLRNMD